MSLKIRKTASLLAALALTAITSATFADSVTYTFTGTGAGTTLISTLPSTPLSSVSAENGGTVVQTSTFGLGVNSFQPLSFNPFQPIILDAAPALININGASIPEYVQFNFIPSVNVTSISFTAFNDNGGFLDPLKIAGDNPTVSYSTDGSAFTGPFVTHITSGNTFTFTDIPAGTNILNLRIGTNALADIGDAFGIGTLSVNYTSSSSSGNGQPSPVPLPSAAAAGIPFLALLGLVMVKRKKLV